MGAFVATLVTGACLVAEPWLGHRPALLVYLAAIVVAGPALDRAGVYVMAGCSALAWNFFFTQPRFTLYMDDREDIALLVLFGVITFAIARLARTARERETEASGEVERRRALYDITARLTAGDEPAKAVAGALRLLSEAYDAEASVIRFGKNGAVEILGDPAGNDLVNSARSALEEKLPILRHVEIPENGRTQHFVLPAEHENAVLSLRFRSASPADYDRAETLRIAAHLFALTLERR